MTEERRGVFQIERVVRDVPLWVAGRVLEGVIRTGDLLEADAEAGPARTPVRFLVGGIDVFRREVPEVTGGLVAALRLDAVESGPPPQVPPRGATLSVGGGSAPGVRG